MKSWKYKMHYVSTTKWMLGNILLRATYLMRIEF